MPDYPVLVLRTEALQPSSWLLRYYQNQQCELESLPALPPTSRHMVRNTKPCLQDVATRWPLQGLTAVISLLRMCFYLYTRTSKRYKLTCQTKQSCSRYQRYCAVVLRLSRILSSCGFKFTVSQRYNSAHNDLGSLIIRAS